VPPSPDSQQRTHPEQSGALGSLMVTASALIIGFFEMAVTLQLPQSMRDWPRDAGAACRRAYVRNAGVR